MNIIVRLFIFMEGSLRNFFIGTGFNVVLTFKINAIKNDLKQSSINSYVKKMKVIMNSAYKDGHISERFNIPDSVVEEIPSNPPEIITYKEIEQGIAKITNIHQTNESLNIPTLKILIVLNKSMVTYGSQNLYSARIKFIKKIIVLHILNSF